MEFTSYLNEMVSRDASDLYLLTGAPASLKFLNTMYELNQFPLEQGYIKSLAYEIMTPAQAAKFEQDLEITISINHINNARFRVNIYFESNTIAMVIRHIRATIPTPEALTLPAVLCDLVMEKRGLILFIGPTGVGKSTSMASLLDHRNRNATGHIVILEDPTEFVHKHQRSLVTQREIGIDSHSYGSALKNTLRQSPDVILIGEIRDDDAMHHALSFSQAGHLCLSTMHANNTAQAILRITNFFAESKRRSVLGDLSGCLLAIVAQRLLPARAGGLVPAFEILINSPLIADYLNRDDIDKIPEVIKKSGNLGMITFDQSLLNMYLEGKITMQDALAYAESPNNLRLAINSQQPTAISSTPISLVENLADDPKSIKHKLFP